MSAERSFATRLLLHALRRRAVLRGLGLAAAGAALPGCATQARAAAPELVEIPVNPQGRLEAAYAVAGHVPGKPVKALSGPVAKRLAAMKPPKAATLRLLHFNDLHNNLIVDDAEKGQTHALAQIVKQVQAARAQAKPGEVVLLVTAGDDRTGGFFDPLLGDIAGAGWRIDPGYAAYSAAGVDVSAIGNHEFDHGARTLARGIRGDAKFPLLAANLSGLREVDAGRDYHPAMIAVAGGLRIGFVGVTCSVIKHFRKAAEPGLTLASPVAAANELLPAVAALSDVVVILSHCGYGDDYGPPRASDGWRFFIKEGDLPLARAAAKLTAKPVVVVGGHTHTTLNKGGLDPENLVDGVPVLQAGARGKYLGDARLTLKSGEKTKFSTRLVRIKPRNDTLAPDHPDYAKAERDADFDADFEARVIGSLKAKMRG